MKNLVLFYSYTGHSKDYAMQLAADEGCELREIVELKPRSKFNCYTVGCYKALRCAKSEIKPLNLKPYDMITIVSPVWAGGTTPAVNAAIDLLPSGKRVKLVLISASGKARSLKAEARVRDKKCTVMAVESIKN